MASVTIQSAPLARGGHVGPVRTVLRSEQTHSERKRAQTTARENDVYWKVQGDVEMAWDERQREKGSSAGL